MADIDDGSFVVDDDVVSLHPVGWCLSSFSSFDDTLLECSLLSASERFVLALDDIIITSIDWSLNGERWKAEWNMRKDAASSIRPGRQRTNASLFKSSTSWADDY